MRIRPDTIATAFDLAYLTLATNLLLALAASPVLAVALTTDTGRSWPLLALAAPFATPGLCAAFAVFAAYGADRSTAVAATFARAWRSSFRPAAAVGALAAAALVVLGVDARAAWGRPAGAVAIPVLATLAVLVVATALHAVSALAARPSARVRDVLRAAVYLAVRHGPLSLLSIAVLVLLLTLFAARPALAVGLAAAPLLYVVWANTRYALRSVLS
jgi:uncharacterized membrane protein YesL